MADGVELSDYCFAVYGSRNGYGSHAESEGEDSCGFHRDVFALAYEQLRDIFRLIVCPSLYTDKRLTV